MCRVRIHLVLACLLIVCAAVSGADEAVRLTASVGSSNWDLHSLRTIVTRVSHDHGIDPRLIDALIRVESDYNVRALSHKGAMGLMQLMPATAQRHSVLDPFDPEQNVKGGVREFCRLVERYSGNLSLALAAYNAGEGAVSKYRGIPPYRETRNYVRRVMSIYTGKPYSLGARFVKPKPLVRIARDPSTGRTVITNHSGRRTKSTTSRAKLSGGFGK